VALLSPIADPQVITWTALAGFDVYILDCEHGPHGVADIHDACRTGRAAGIEVWARIPQADRIWVGQALDAGVTGLVVPHVTTAAEVRRLARLAYYPPRGERGIAGVAGNAYGARTLAEVDAAVSLWIQLEDPAAVASAEELLGAGAIQGALVGPGDLKGRLEGSPEERDAALWSMTSTVFDAARAAGHGFAVVVSRPEELAGYRDRAVHPDLVIVGARFELVARLSGTASAIRGLR
jgi:2-keto-3-deoxy-L-rhamnonate aldolase RhmA